MLLIDEQPPEWRALLNDFPHRAVAYVADRTGRPEMARQILIEQFGEPL